MIMSSVDLVKLAVLSVKHQSTLLPALRSKPHGQEEPLQLA